MNRTLLAILTSALLNTHVVIASDFSEREANTGLSETLKQEASTAVEQLGAENGFFNNPEVKIPLPDSLRRAERLLRGLGLGKQADELELTMNRAAEKAVHEAMPVLTDSVKKISWEDARSIVTGNETAATEYFRQASSEALKARFRPIVHQATSQ